MEENKCLHDYKPCMAQWTCFVSNFYDTITSDKYGNMASCLSASVLGLQRRVGRLNTINLPTLHAEGTPSGGLRLMVFNLPTLRCRPRTETDRGYAILPQPSNRPGKFF